MSPEPLPSNLQPLMEALLLEKMTPAQQQELQELLAHRRDARDYYRRYLDLHVNLLLAGRRQPGSPVPAATGAALKLQSRRRRRWGMALAASVCCLGIMLFLAGPGLLSQLSIPQQEKQQAAVAAAAGPATVQESPARVTAYQDAGAVFFRDSTPAVGHELAYHHPYFLLEGFFEIRSPKGARTIFSAPAAFELKSDEQVLVTYGNCSVYAPEGSEGFEVVTPTSQLIDRGTRFKVSVDEFGASEVHVVEGLVEALESTENGRGEARLEQGHARRYDAGRAALSSAIDYTAEGYKGRLPDRLITYSGAKDELGRIDRLQSATVMRGGETVTYPFDEMIGSDVVSFCENGSPATINLILPHGYQGTREELARHDDSFITGVLNPGGASLAYAGVVYTPENSANPRQWTPGMTVQFREPVINGPGPDILLFEAQTAVHPLDGDHFHVRPLELKPGYHPLTVVRYDVGMLSPESQPMAPFTLLATDNTVSSLAELNAVEMRNCRNIMVNYRVVATGIDLSRMGVPEGHALTDIFIQDVVDDEFRVDPVLIVGLPPHPVPQKSGPARAD